MRRIHVLVRGRVQGVFFRRSCAERARARGVTGWVRNTADGGVEAEFEGDEDGVAAMVAWCREGPPGAQVLDLEVLEVASGGGSGFRITG